MKNFFLDSRLRQDSIIKFGILFANIANLEDVFKDYRLIIVEDTKDIEVELKMVSSKLIEFVNKTKLYFREEELLSLILLTIYSFMLDVLNDDVEFLFYLTTILAYIKKESIFNIDKSTFKKIEEVLSIKILIYNLHMNFIVPKMLISNLIIYISDNKFINSPIEYFRIGYIMDMLGKKLNTKKHI